MSIHDAQMLKGVLALLLLSLLADEDNYGYGIVTALREAGFTDLAEGTVYPALTGSRPPVISSPTSSARPAGRRASTTGPQRTGAPTSSPVASPGMTWSPRSAGSVA